MYDLTHMKFLGHYRPEEEEAACGCCNEPGRRGSQRNPLPAQSHTHICAHESVFWVRRSHVRIRLHPILAEVGQQLAAGRSINQGGSGVTLGWCQTTGSSFPCRFSCLIDAPTLNYHQHSVSLEETMSVRSGTR